MPLPPDDPRHGKYTTYTNHECRCAKCRKAAQDYFREWRRTHKGQVPPGIEHGTLSTYKNYGCKCDACRAANAKRGRNERAGKRRAPQP